MGTLFINDHCLSTHSAYSISLHASNTTHTNNSWVVLGIASKHMHVHRETRLTLMVLLGKWLFPNFQSFQTKKAYFCFVFVLFWNNVAVNVRGRATTLPTHDVHIKNGECTTLNIRLTLTHSQESEKLVASREARLREMKRNQNNGDGGNAHQ